MNEAFVNFSNYTSYCQQVQGLQATHLTLFYLNLFKEIKKRNLKHSQTSEKQIDILFMSISETAELYWQRSKL